MKLVHDHISSDTVEMCKQLLEAAAGGQIVGLGIVIMLKRQRYMVDACGEVERNPTFARGAIRDLDEFLRDIIHDHRDPQTTI